LRKKIVDILDGIYREAEDAENSSAKLLGGSGRQQSRGKAPVPGLSSRAGKAKAGAIDVEGLPRAELADLITQMNEQMLAAARELQFEVAARLRDELHELKKELRQLDAAHA
jgi:excinuclease ABC subunit B